MTGLKLARDGLIIAGVTAMVLGGMAFRSKACAQTTVIGREGRTITIMRTQPQPRAVWDAPDLRTDAERAARTAAWEARCRPTPGAPDHLGVSRMIYAAPGCEFGD